MNSNIKIAYIVLCHKNAGQINKMIKKLDSKNCDFFLHIDKISFLMYIFFRKYGNIGRNCSKGMSKNIDLWLLYNN